MTKILFTADLHIRVGQKNIPRSWALFQYEQMFSELDRVFKEQECDLEVHGGDIFDKVPTMEELSIYIEYLWRDPTRQRVLYDGNHEATKKGDTFLKYLRPMLPPDTELFTSHEVYTDLFDVLPYADLNKLKSIKPVNDVLLTHVRGNIPPHVKAEVDLELFKRWSTVYAGDLHAHSNSQENIVYPGSPRTVSFHRNKVKLGVVTFTNANDWEWHQIKVPQLIRKTVSSAEDMIKTEFDHTIYELEGSILELAKIDKDNDLLDKKLIYNEQPATLNLSNMTIEQELEKYLSDILLLDKKEIKRVLEVFSASI